ncbi:MAG TPA: rhodanese-like domain-containing protein [candidate division Zixibacteria bacterium]|nr:rhodanese-like domain-containing protein [candidate division Zixibacteria bacterium]
MAIKESIIIVVLSVMISLIVNVFSPNSIPIIGQYRDLHTGDGPIVPPDSGPNDPPFIAVDVAELDFSQNAAVFIDARDPDEFECSTIPGSINIPFEELPEGDLGLYIDSCLGGVDKNQRIITFCSGEECDLSLHLARNMQALGYTNLAIFFGGSREWEKFGLEMERRKDCGE